MFIDQSLTNVIHLQGKPQRNILLVALTPPPFELSGHIFFKEFLFSSLKKSYFFLVARPHPLLEATKRNATSPIKNRNVIIPTGYIPGFMANNNLTKM